MKKIVTGFVGMLLLSMACFASSTPGATGPQKAGLAFAEAYHMNEKAPAFGEALDFEAWKRRKRRKKRTLAVGVVVGAPAGLGARGIFRFKTFGVAGDIAYNRVRSDSGPLVNTLVSKLDARFYRKGLLGKLLRVYVFGGATMQRGRWDANKMESAFQIDAGIGGGIKLWSLSINAEAGLLIPAVSPENFNPGFGVFANVAVMAWLF